MSRRPPRTSDIISLLLNPSLLTGGFFLMLVRRFEPSGRRWLVGSIALVFTVVVPLASLFVLKALGRLSDVEMRIRSERTTVYLSCAVSYAVGLALYVHLGAAWPLTSVMALLLSTALVLALLNQWWKVSIHTTTLAGLATVGMALFGGAALPFVLLVLVAAWARWAAGAHTPGELVSGIALGACSAAAGLLATRAWLVR